MPSFVVCITDDKVVDADVVDDVDEEEDVVGDVVAAELFTFSAAEASGECRDG